MERHQDPSRHLDELIARDDFVRRLAQSLTQRGDEADDAAQETWLASLATRRGDGLRPTRSWLAFVVRRMLAHGRRGRARRAAREAIAAKLEAIPSVQRIAEREELRRHLVEAVHALAPEHRDVVLLCYFEGLPPRRIAQALGVSVECVRSRLKRALHELREHLDAASKGGRARWMSVLGAWAWKETAVAGAGAGLALKGILIVSTKMKLAAVLVVLCVMIAVVVRRFANDERPTDLVERDSRNASTESRATDAVRSNDTSEASKPAIGISVIEAAEAATDERRSTRPNLASLRIRVLLEDGSPLPGVGVDVHRSNDMVRFPVRFAAVTDASGVATIAGIADGEYLANTDRGGDTASVEIMNGEPAECTIELNDGIDVRGEVVDGDGAAVPNAEIILLQGVDFPGGRPVGRSDQEGKFEIRAINWAMGIGARAVGRAPSAFVSIDSRAKSDKVRQVRVVLDRSGGAVAGVVVDARDNPVSGAVIIVGKESRTLIGVNLVGGETGFVMQAFGCRSGADGTFRIEGLPSGDFPIEVRSIGLAPWRSRVTVFEGATADCRSVLRTGARIVGQVRHLDGSFATGVTIHAGDPDDIATPRTFVDERGGFSMEHLEPVRTRLRAKSTDGSRDAVELDLVDGETSQWDPVLDPGLSISGRVENVEGEPAGGFTVDLWRRLPSGDRMKVDERQTSEDGRFVFSGLDDVGHLLEVSYVFGQILTSKSDVRPSRNDVVLVVDLAAAGSARIVGVLVDETGRPVVDAMVYSLRQGSGRGSLCERSGSDGRFALESLAPGPNDLFVVPRNLVMKSLAALPLENDRTYDVGRIVLETGGSIEAVIRRRDGGEVGTAPLAIVSLDDDGEPVGPPRPLILDGNVGRSAKISAGRYRLFHGPPTKSWKHWDLEIRSGEVSRTTIEIGVAARRVIRIVESKRSTASRLNCTLDAGAGVFEIRDVARADDGAFVLEFSIDPGTYVLETGTSDGTRRRQTIDLGLSGAPEAPLVIDWNH